MAVRKKVEALLKLPGNNECADCTAPKPNWASASCGVFVCFNCSGLHRGLGTHLSFVRSVNLDEWTEKQYKKMKEWGNLNANAYFEARLDKKKPDQHASVNEMNRYIRDKYEMGKWVPDGGEGDPRRGGKPSRSPRAAASEPTPEPRKAAKPRVKVSSRKAQPKPAAAPAQRKKYSGALDRNSFRNVKKQEYGAGAAPFAFIGLCAFAYYLLLQEEDD